MMGLDDRDLLELLHGQLTMDEYSEYVKYVVAKEDIYKEAVELVDKSLYQEVAKDVYAGLALAETEFNNEMDALPDDAEEEVYLAATRKYLRTLIRDMRQYADLMSQHPKFIQYQPKLEKIYVANGVNYNVINEVNKKILLLINDDKTLDMIIDRLM